MNSFTFNSSIRTTLTEVMQKDPSVLLLGLGITDPKAFFGTTEGLVEKFGAGRLLECPTSENGYLGHSLGLALSGFRPVTHFQRMDFMLYAFDQLVNNAAKWKSMFAMSRDIPLTIRTLIGMGWGQGAQHSQNFGPLLSRTPGIITVAPSCPQSAAFLLKESIFGHSPTVVIEHRWLQYLKQTQEHIQFQSGKAIVRRHGKKITVVTWSYSTAEALRFSEIFPESDFEIIDLLYLSTPDIETIANSVGRTGKIIFWEPCTAKSGLGSELMAQLYQMDIKFQPAFIHHPFAYPASSPYLNQNYYSSLADLTAVVNRLSGLNLNVPKSAIWPADKDLAEWSPWG